MGLILSKHKSINCNNLLPCNTPLIHPHHRKGGGVKGWVWVWVGGCVGGKEQKHGTLGIWIPATAAFLPPRRSEPLPLLTNSHRLSPLCVITFAPLIPLIIFLLRDL